MKYIRSFLLFCLNLVTLRAQLVDALNVSAVLPSNAELYNTFSSVYGKVQALKNFAKEAYKINTPQKLSLFRSILKREMRFAKKGYTVFYHANIDAAVIMQEFFKVLYSKLEKKIVPNEFEFLRFYKMNTAICLPAPTWVKQQREMIKDSSGSYTCCCAPWGINDNIDPYKSQLLSTNLSLFGNASLVYGGESTLNFFDQNSNISPPSIYGLVESTLAAVGYTDVVNDIYLNLKQLCTMVKGFPALMQIAIPNALVDSVAYLSGPFGRPLDGSGTSILTSVCSENRITKTLKAISLLTQKADHVDPYFFDHVQARLLFQSQYMLNPFSGIKIVRHTLLSKAELKKVKEAVMHIVDAFIPA